MSQEITNHDPNSWREWKLHLRRVNGLIKANRGSGMVFIYTLDTIFIFDNSYSVEELTWLRGLREKIIKKINELKGK